VSGTGATSSAGTTRACEASGLTILLADDEAAIRNLTGQVLRSYGYRVLEAADGLEALEVAQPRKARKVGAGAGARWLEWRVETVRAGGELCGNGNGHDEWSEAGGVHGWLPWSVPGRRGAKGVGPRRALEVALLSVGVQCARIGSPPHGSP